MKLIYRGVAYQYSPPQLRLTETELALKYRGANWRSRKLIDMLVPQLAFQLKYRGISYSTAQSLAPELPIDNVCLNPVLS